MTRLPADVDLVEVRPEPLALDDSRRIVEANQATAVAFSDGGPFFSGFYRGSGSHPTGSGLGPGIGGGLVASHGGEFIAESKPGSGSTFRLTLPLIDLDKLQDS
jgi:signal transduction histidine kinase